MDSPWSRGKCRRRKNGGTTGAERDSPGVNAMGMRMDIMASK